MVTITSSHHMVVPRSPTPTGYINFSELDQLQPQQHSNLVYLYKPTQKSTDFTEIMRNSLSSILVHHYPVAGRLQRIKGERFQLECNARGVPFWEAESESEMTDYGDFAPTEAVIRDLYPKADYETPIETWPLLMVKVTRFSCGGLCFVVGISHVVMDGLAVIHLVNSWAKMARGESLGKDEIPLHDRTSLMISRAEPKVRASSFDHRPFKAPPLVLGCSDAQAEQKKETAMAIFKFTKEQIRQLKKKAIESSNGDQKLAEARPYSTYEALAAHIWRCTCMARQNESHQPTSIRFVSNIRSKLNPRLPPNYAGNAILPMWTDTCLSGDIIQNPLSFASKKIREAIEKLTDEYIRSAMEFVATQEHVNWLRRSAGHFYGNPNMDIGGLLNMPLYDADFGWGKPIYAGLGFLRGDGRAYMTPSAAGDGSVIVALRLQTKHMEAFKKFCYEDLPLLPADQSFKAQARL